MQEFLNIVLSMPTAPFTVALALALLYWGFMLLGVVDLDVFDIDVDVDLDIEGGGAGGLASALSALGLSGVPLTVTLSAFVFVGWCVTSAVALKLGDGTTPLTMGTSVAVLGGGGVGGLLGTVIVLRPLRGVFETVGGHDGAHAMVGETVKILSGEVTRDFGTGEVELEGVTARVSLRCDEPGHTLAKGDDALIVSYDEAAHAYMVVPLGEMLMLESKEDDMNDMDDETNQEEAPEEAPSAAT